MQKSRSLLRLVLGVIAIAAGSIFVIVWIVTGWPGTGEISLRPKAFKNLEVSVRHEGEDDVLSISDKGRPLLLISKRSDEDSMDLELINKRETNVFSLTFVPNKDLWRIANYTHYKESGAGAGHELIDIDFNGQFDVKLLVGANGTIESYKIFLEDSWKEVDDIAPYEMEAFAGKLKYIFEDDEGWLLYEDAAEIESAVIEDSVYTNKFFGFSMRLPEGWEVQGDNVKEKLLERGDEITTNMVGDVQTLGAVNHSRILNLLLVLRNSVESSAPGNPGILCLCNKIEFVSESDGLKENLYQTRKLLEESRIKYTFPKEIYSETLGEIAFDVLETETTGVDMVIRQKYYGTVRKGYALYFIVTFVTEDDLESIRESLESLHFENI